MQRDQLPLDMRHMTSVGAVDVSFVMDGRELSLCAIDDAAPAIRDLNAMMKREHLRRCIQAPRGNPVFLPVSAVGLLSFPNPQ